MTFLRELEHYFVHKVVKFEIFQESHITGDMKSLILSFFKWRVFHEQTLR